MSREYLNGRLECPTCGTIRLDIPEDAAEDTLVRCAQCHALMGPWGELQDDFIRQSGKGVFDLREGRIMRRE